MIFGPKKRFSGKAAERLPFVFAADSDRAALRAEDPAPSGISLPLPALPSISPGNEPLLEIFSGDGGTEQVPLAHVAPEKVEDVALLLGLDAFGDGLEIEAPGQRGDRADDGSRVLVNGDVAHEGYIDLEVVQGQLFDITERGIPGPEVIDRDRDADVLELFQASGRQNPCPARRLSPSLQASTAGDQDGNY